ncbi:transposase, partial [Planctomycetota bacterium]
QHQFRLLEEDAKAEVEHCVNTFSESQRCELIEFNIQSDHALVMIPSKISLSGYVGPVMGRTAISVSKAFHKLKEKPYWCNRFWLEVIVLIRLVSM